MTDTLRIAEALVKAKQIREDSYVTIGPRVKLEKVHSGTGAKLLIYTQEGHYSMGWIEAAHRALGVSLEDRGNHDVRLVVLLSELVDSPDLLSNSESWARAVIHGRSEHA